MKASRLFRNVWDRLPAGQIRVGPASRRSPDRQDAGPTQSLPGAVPGAVVLLALGALLAGCGQPRTHFLTPPEPPILWPAAPDQPRVRYIGALSSTDDLPVQRTLGEVMEDLVYGPVAPDRLVSPQAVAVDASGTRVAVADVNGKCVHLFDLAARRYTLLVQAGDIGTDKSPGRGIAMECPVAVCWAGETLWAADAKLHALAIFDRRGPGRWVGAIKLKRPAGMAYCPTNQLCYVCDAGAHRVLAFDAKGEVVAEFGLHGAGPGEFNAPSHIACSGDALVIADSLNFRVQRVGLDGTPLNAFGQKGDAAGDMALPKGVAVDPSGAIWVVDAHFENVQAFAPDGKLLMALGKEGHGPGEFWLPAGICIDGQNRMWIADTYNRRVQVFALLP